MMTPRTGKQVSALLVEEDPAIVDRVTDLLGQLGYTTAVLTPAMALAPDVAAQ